MPRQLCLARPCLPLYQVCLCLACPLVQEEQAETDPVRKDVKSPNMEIVVVGSNVTTGKQCWLGGDRFAAGVNASQGVLGCNGQLSRCKGGVVPLGC